jgi:hypothetical protein
MVPKRESVISVSARVWDRLPESARDSLQIHWRKPQQMSTHQHFDPVRWCSSLDGVPIKSRKGAVMEIKLAKLPDEKSVSCQWICCGERGWFSVDAPQFFKRGGQVFCGHHALELLAYLSSEPLADTATQLNAA